MEIFKLKQQKLNIILVNNSATVKCFKKLIEYLKSSTSNVFIWWWFYENLIYLGLNIGFDKFYISDKFRSLKIYRSKVFRFEFFRSTTLKITHEVIDWSDVIDGKLQKINLIEPSRPYDLHILPGLARRHSERAQNLCRMDHIWNKCFHVLACDLHHLNAFLVRWRRVCRR